jgi:hypothetical protein
MPLWSFQGARELERPQDQLMLVLANRAAGLSKLNSMNVEVDIRSKRDRGSDGSRAIKDPIAYRSKSSDIP